MNLHTFSHHFGHGLHGTLTVDAEALARDRQIDLHVTWHGGRPTPRTTKHYLKWKRHVWRTLSEITGLRIVEITTVAPGKHSVFVADEGKKHE